MLKGTLDDFSLPDIFRLMSFAKRTGSLQVERSAGRGTVYFRDGDVYFAESSLSKEPLGQKLVKMKAITEGQLRKALDQHASEGKRLGTVLLETGMVDEEQIMGAVREQIADAAFDLLRWELGEFLWEPGAAFEPEIEIFVSVENLIMEASRRLEELEIIQRKIPSVDTVLAMAPKPPEGAVEINITPDEWRMLVLVNGERTVADIAQFTGADEFATMKSLYGLVSAGLIEVPGHAEQFEEILAETPTPAESSEAAEAAAEEAPAEEEPADTIAAAEQPEIQAEAVEAPLADQPAGIGPLVEPEGDDLAAEADVPEGAEPVAASAETTAPPEGEAEAWTEVHGAAPQAPEEVPVEGFDAPAPGELTTEGPLGDPFADEILAPEPAFPEMDKTSENGLAEAPAPEAPAFPETPAAEAEPAAAPPAPEAEPEAEAEAEVAAAGPEEGAEEAPPAAIPVSSETAGESPAVDRIAAVRELAGLFTEEGDGGGEAPSKRPAPAAGAPDAKKRVEDDEHVTRGLISRLIDGVKGL